LDVSATPLSLQRDSRRRTNVKAWLLVLLAAGLAAAFLSGAHGSPAASAASAVATPVDVEIAIDGTESMGTAIARAKSEGARALSGVSSLLPDSRFAVVVFRDHGNPAGEYQLLQPLTSDAAQVNDALNRVTTHSNPSPQNGLAESYNLAFEESYSDARIGWRPSARKIVVVLGDAEPNGAGTAGLPGCHDQSRDPEGLSTPRELAKMREAKRTLIMIRELSSEVSTSLQCYESIAKGAFVGGAARDANADIAGLIVEEIVDAYAPVTVKNDLGVALRNASTGYTITVRNPNALALKIKALTFVLPSSGFRYLRSSIASTRPVQSGRTLSWALNTSLGPRQRLGFHVLLRTPGHVGRYRSSLSTQLETAGGNELVSRRPVGLLSVKRSIHAVNLFFRGRTAAANTLTGRAGVRFGRWRGLPAIGPARGRLILRRGTKRVVLQAAGLRLDSLAVPTRARLRLRIIASAGYRGCPLGARATLFVTDSYNVRQDSRTTTPVLSLPPACGGKITPTATLAFSAS
jgi:von Willebrand factor type A domain